MLRTKLALLWACLAGACAASTATAPQEPVDPTADYYPALSYTRLIPPAWYREVWDGAVRCMEQHGYPAKGRKFDEIVWFAVSADAIPMPNGTWALGYYSHGKIFLLAHLVTERWIVAHEAIHAAGYVLDHPPALFTECVSPYY